MWRRRLLLSALSAPFVASAPRIGRATAIDRSRTLLFPRDHGAHLDARIEWWYATGWLGPIAAPRLGFQITFFRSRTDLGAELPGRFAPRQLLFAHAAVTDLVGSRHRHAQRIARWSGAPDAGAARAAIDRTDVRIGRWHLVDDGGGYRVHLDDESFRIDLRLRRRQPLLMQGDAGFSRKGPMPDQASHYVTEPQLEVEGDITLDGRQVAEPGRAWLDHEWSEQLLAADAVGWDWVGINLEDGSALTAFRLRRIDGSTLWGGGSWRAPGAPAQSFAADVLQFSPGRTWTSPSSGARYPVSWQIETPVGSFTLNALMDAQELDSRASTGTIYWEGLSELLDGQGRRIGLGYLEMTGYAGRLRL